MPSRTGICIAGLRISLLDPRQPERIMSRNYVHLFLFLFAFFSLPLTALGKNPRDSYTGIVKLVAGPGSLSEVSGASGKGMIVLCEKDSKEYFGAGAGIVGAQVSHPSGSGWKSAVGGFGYPYLHLNTSWVRFEVGVPAGVIHVGATDWTTDLAFGVHASLDLRIWGPVSATGSYLIFKTLTQMGVGLKWQLE